MCVRICGVLFVMACGLLWHFQPQQSFYDDNCVSEHEDRLVHSATSQNSIDCNGSAGAGTENGGVWR